MYIFNNGSFGVLMGDFAWNELIYKGCYDTPFISIVILINPKAVSVGFS